MKAPRGQRVIGGIAVVVVLAIAALGLRSWLRRQPETEIAPLRVGYQPTMLYLPLFVAQDKGFFDEESVKVKLVRFTSANEMAQALAARQLDATGMSSLTVLANLEANSSNIFRIYLLEVLTSKHSPDALIVKPDSTISAIGDLRGKKLGVHPGTTLQSYVEPILSKRIGPNHGVTVIPLAPHLQVQALAVGNVDALFVLEPIPTLAQIELKARIVERALLARSVHEPFYAGAGVLSREFVEKDPAKVIRFKAAMKKALHYITTHEAEARRSLKSYAEVSAEVAEKMELVEWLDPADASLVDWKTSLRILEELKLIPAGTKLEQYFHAN